MNYIVHKRFKGKSVSGEVNIPAMTECKGVEGLIFHEGKIICIETSENAHQHFAVNDDGNGLERGRLTQGIVKTLNKQDKDYQARWDKVWGNLRCRKYKRTERDDYWLWNHDFFTADIEELRYIAALVGAKAI